MSYILDPISIATHGYAGQLADLSEYGPEPISIATHGYVRFEYEPVTGGGVGGGYRPRPAMPIRRKDRDREAEIREAILREDREIIEFIVAVVTKHIL